MTEETSKLNNAVGEWTELSEESLRRPIEETNITDEDNKIARKTYLDMKEKQLTSNAALGDDLSTVVTLIRNFLDSMSHSASICQPDSSYLASLCQLQSFLESTQNMSKILKDKDIAWEVERSIEDTSRTGELAVKAKENHVKRETQIQEVSKTIKSEKRKRCTQSEILTGNKAEVTLSPRSFTHPGGPRRMPQSIEAHICVLVSIAQTNNEETTKCVHCGVKKESVENEETSTTKF